MRTRYIPFRVYRRLGGMTPHITPQNEGYTEKVALLFGEIIYYE